MKPMTVLMPRGRWTTVYDASEVEATLTAANARIAELEATIKIAIADKDCAWANNGILERARQAADAEVARLQAFKEYVHQRLDDAGIDATPNGQHSTAGCRIGDRLDIALAEKQAREAVEIERDGTGSPAEMSDYKPKIRQLPGARLSAETVLGRTFDKRARIKGVAIAIMWDDGAIAADWSQMKKTDFAAMARVMQIEADRELMAGGAA